MMREVPAELSGTASGTMNTFRHLGSAFGVALAGILSPERDGSVATTMYVTFVVAAVGALAAATIPIRVLRQRTVAHT
jgi:DHA2 family methylenomycin A resistance protein-like MFS transporter